MKLHKNASLTPIQRRKIKELYETGKYSRESLATEFKVNYKTIYKWTCRDVFTDKQRNPPSKPSKITAQFVLAVEAYRKNPTTSHHGKVRIAHELKKTHSCSNASNVYTVLKHLKLNQPKQSKDQQQNTIPVGKHRTQMDIQFLPAIEGDEGFSYKISIIHLSTRIKYSEIHADYESKTIAGVYQRAIERLPPFL